MKNRTSTYMIKQGANMQVIPPYTRFLQLFTNTPDL